MMHGLTEPQQGEVPLQHAESIVETWHHPILVLDRDFLVQSANAAFYQTFQLTPDKAEGKSIDDLRSGEWNIAKLHTILEAALSDRSVDETFVVESTFSEVGHKVLSVNAWKIEPSDRSELIVLAMEDLTDRKQASTNLGRSESQCRLIMDATPAILAYVEPDLRFRVVNDAYKRWFGVPAGKLVGQTVKELFGSSVWRVIQPYVERVLAGETVSFEAEYPTPNGARTLHVTYTPDLDRFGAVKGFLVLGNDLTDRKQAEIQLRQSEERWRSLFEFMAEGFFVGQMVEGDPPDVRFVEVNPAFETLTGISGAAGRTLRALIPDIDDSLIERYAHVVSSGEPAHLEILIPALKNSWYEVRAHRTQPGFFAVLFSNITARKAVEAQLLENEKRQRALVTLGDRLRDLHDLSDLSAAAMEIVGNVMGVARAGYGQVDSSQIFVTIERDWTNGKVASLAGTYRFEDFGEDLGASLRRGESFVVPDVTTHPITNRDSARWEALDIRAVINLPLIENGRLAALLFIQDTVKREWTNSDLSFLRKVADRTWAAADRSRALRELQESESFTRSVLESSPDCIMVLDLQGRMRTINDSGCMQLEIEDLGVCIDRPWLDFWTASSESAADALSKARGGQTQHFEGLRPDRKGNPRWWEVVVSPIRDAVGRPVRILAVLRDITLRKAAEQERERLTLELKRSNEELAQFAHTVAHDLQSPLRGITLFAQLLHQHTEERLVGKEAVFLEHIVTSGRRMTELVQGLLRFAQVGQGRIEMRPISMQPTLSAALQSLRLQIDEQSAIVSYRDMPTVLGDSVQLSQLLQNLISNALKYHRSGVPPQVEISAVREGSHFRFAVADNGEGIDSKHLTTVFEPLKRVHDGDVPGSGLGLAVCQRIVDRHGGRIWVESTLNQGSCFYFTLPAA